jgi:glycogen debranching enzyme
MDSVDRAGMRIEVQAGRLALYKLLFEETGNDQYKILLEEAEKKTIETFFKNGTLLDAPDDPTVRPNVFLAYCMYPEFLAKEDWEKCFDKILPELYLPWGGISSVSQSDKKFKCKDEGENCAGYHNGDSWYFLSDLAATALYEINPAKYSKYINGIMEASTREILYMGAIGHHGEISSAESQQSLGCAAQLWSSAMYLEFFDAVIGE